MDRPPDKDSSPPLLLFVLVVAYLVAALLFVVKKAEKMRDANAKFRRMGVEQTAFGFWAGPKIRKIRSLFSFPPP